MDSGDFQIYFLHSFAMEKNVFNICISLRTGTVSCPFVQCFVLSKSAYCNRNITRSVRSAASWVLMILHSFCPSAYLSSSSCPALSHSGIVLWRLTHRIRVYGGIGKRQQVNLSRAFISSLLEQPTSFLDSYPRQMTSLCPSPNNKTHNAEMVN